MVLRAGLGLAGRAYSSSISRSAACRTGQQALAGPGGPSASCSAVIWWGAFRWLAAGGPLAWRAAMGGWLRLP